MSLYFALFLALLLGSSAYAAGRLHAQLGYRVGYRHGYRQGHQDGVRAEWTRALEDARAAAVARAEQLEEAERRGYATAVGDYRAGGGDAEVEQARRDGYALAIERLRDDERYRYWWTARQYAPEDRYWKAEARNHLADYLEMADRSVEELLGGPPASTEQADPR